MYLHIGNNVVVPEKDVIGVFDLDNATTDARDTREFLKAAERAGRVVNAAEDLPKAFILCGDAVYLSQLSTATLFKRSETNSMEY